MRRAYNRLAVLSALMNIGVTTDLKTGKKINPKKGFVFGDQFYNAIPYKRIDGKWRVKR
jgi:hypothetical protein